MPSVGNLTERWVNFQFPGWVSFTVPLTILDRPWPQSSWSSNTGNMLSAETLHQWMIAEGLWRPRQCRWAVIHRRRTLRPPRGTPVQIDGSPRLVRGTVVTMHPHRLHRRCLLRRDGSVLRFRQNHPVLHGNPRRPSRSTRTSGRSTIRIGTASPALTIPTVRAIWPTSPALPPPTSCRSTPAG